MQPPQHAAPPQDTPASGWRWARIADVGGHWTAAREKPLASVWAIAGSVGALVFWLAVALVGQASALSLIDAGPRIHYQHYRKLHALFGDPHSLSALVLLLQIGWVSAALAFRWRAIVRWGSTYGWLGLAGVGVIFVLSSAALSRDPRDYAVELAFATLVQVVNLGNIVLIAWALPEALGAQLGRLVGFLRGRRVALWGGHRIIVAAALWVTILAAVLNVVAYQRHPHVPDEVLYLYQARSFAAGMLSTPAPPVPEAFSIYMIPTGADRWYSPFPPGWPALLAVGEVLRVPWLINPILGGLNVILTFLVVREIYSVGVARLVILLLCVSPWYVFMAMSFMSHTSALTAALVAALAIARARSTGRAWWAFGGGTAIGVLSLIRPLDAVAIGALLGLWALGVGGARLRPSALAAFVAGAVLAGSLVLPYNLAVTGDATVHPLDAYYETYYGPKANALGFGPERGLGWELDAWPGHSPLEALVNANLNSFSVNIELFGWSTGSLIFVALLLFSRRLRRPDYLMLAVIVAVAGLYSLYWFSGGPDFGARYWYLILVPLVALTARGIQAMVDTRPGEADQGRQSRMRIAAAVVALCAMSLVTYFPWRASDKYHHYLGMRPDVIDLAEENGLSRSLVLIQGVEHPDYQSAWTYNPLDLTSGETVYAWDRSPEVRQRLLATYSDRPIWVVEAPSITGAGYRVVNGPLAAGDLIASEAAAP